MCGFAGFLMGSNGINTGRAIDHLHAMADTIANRGPDSAGYWQDSNAGIGLAHRRLSILDLSSAGAQPMISVSGRYVIAFNGEIYNHLVLRDSLEREASTNIVWRGNSDTETVLAAFDAWGIKETMNYCSGMFAFAVWDRSTRTLTLGRDRVGEKPLYYGWQGAGEDATFVFGSELKALRKHPSFSAKIDKGALSLLMRHNYVPAPFSIYCGIYKLMPGTLLSLSSTHKDPLIESYWSLTDVVNTGDQQRFSGSTEQAIEELDSLLKAAVRQQMVADVPLGAFLSGGIDSSTIVSLMQAQSSNPVQTFTIGFHESDYNEASHAKAVAKHLGTQHTEIYVTAQEALDVIPKLPTLYCEPFSDSSQIPTYLVSKLAKQNVTVSLSGDAGDELFAGYSRYVMANSLWTRLNRFPVTTRSIAANGILALSPTTWNKIVSPLKVMLPKSLQMKNFGDKLHKGAGVLSSKNIDQLYLSLVSHWDPDDIVIDSYEPPTFLNGNIPLINGLNDIQKMMLLDSITYLPDDILVKVDRASMGVSLESRTPFLDHKVVEFAWSLPQSLKLREGVGKWILRQVLYKYVPKELVERPKMGFGVPIGSWLRGPLRDWAEELLDEKRLSREGFFDPKPIRLKWAEHLSGQRNWQYHLWDVLMFQSWLENEGNV
jgi:asparagine synthase (glutamine-hydrolysing)